jgi:hypothetical protein
MYRLRHELARAFNDEPSESPGKCEIDPGGESQKRLIRLITRPGCADPWDAEAKADTGSQSEIGSACAFHQQIDEDFEGPAPIQLRIRETKYQNAAQMQIMPRFGVIRMGGLRGVHRFDEARAGCRTGIVRTASHGLRAGGLRP